MKRMFSLLILLSAITNLSYADSKQPVLLVSDVDDTIKITNIPSKLKKIKNAIFSQRAFTGMSELYQEITANSILAGGDEKPFYILTGGPVFWRPMIKSLLNRNEFPAYQKIHTRNFLREKTFDFKVRVLIELTQTTPAPLLLFGDDTEVDFDIFSEVKKRAPDQVAAMYIRQTVNKPLPAGIIPFYTSLDVALAEVKAGRLSESQAIRVGKTILAEEDTSLILPGFASCPKVSAALVNTSELEQVTTEVSLKIQKICNDRNVAVDLMENNIESDSDISEIISPVME